jgi:hypothetical protein
LRNAEHSHALAGNNYLLQHACPRTPFSLFLQLSISIDSNPYL